MVRYPPRTMPDDRQISDEEVLTTLAGCDSLDDWVLIGGDLPGYVSEQGRLEALLIEDDALADACVYFLRRRGARVVDPRNGR